MEKQKQLLTNLNIKAENQFNDLLDKNMKFNTLVMKPHLFFTDDVSFLFYYTSEYVQFLVKSKLLETAQNILLEAVAEETRSIFKNNSLRFKKMNVAGSNDLFLLYDDIHIFQINPTKKRFLYYDKDFQVYPIKKKKDFQLLNDEFAFMVFDYLENLDYEYNGVVFKKSRIKQVVF